MCARTGSEVQSEEWRTARRNMQHTTYNMPRGDPACSTACLPQTRGWIGAYDRVIDIHNVRAPSAGKTKPLSVCSCAFIKHFDGWWPTAATEDAMAHRMQVALHLCASLAARQRMCAPPPTALRLFRAHKPRGIPVPRNDLVGRPIRTLGTLSYPSGE